MNNKFSFLQMIYLICISFASLSYFSFTTSFFFNNPSSCDSAVFQIIGKGWLQGDIPYVDLWDLKGPIIFFVNYLGYLITGSRYGIFLIEFLSLTFTLFVLALFLNNHFSRLKTCVLLTLFTLSFSSMNLGGNGTEEYLLPFLSLAYCIMYKWCKRVERDETVIHPPKYALLYGFILGFSLLTRLTNAIGVCAACAVIFFWLANKHSWHNVGLNIVTFLLGFCVIVLPFVGYFAWNNALHDMWYGTFLYNLDYAKLSSQTPYNVTRFAKSFIIFSETWLLLGVSIMTLLFSKKRLSGILWLSVSLFSLLWLMKGFGFAHYQIISLPLMCIAFTEIKAICTDTRQVLVKKLSLGLFTCYAIVVFGFNVHIVELFNRMYIDNKPLVQYKHILENLPYDYKNSFTAYNCTADLYLNMDITPHNKFFSLQDFQAGASETLKQQLIEDFSKNSPKWILVEGEAKLIQEVITSRYNLNTAVGNLKVYRLCD